MAIMTRLWGEVKKLATSVTWQ